MLTRFFLGDCEVFLFCQSVSDKYHLLSRVKVMSWLSLISFARIYYQCKSHLTKAFFIFIWSINSALTQFWYNIDTVLTLFISVYVSFGSFLSQVQLQLNWDSVLIQFWLSIHTFLTLFVSVYVSFDSALDQFLSILSQFLVSFESVFFSFELVQWISILSEL